MRRRRIDRDASENSALQARIDDLLCGEINPADIEAGKEAEEMRAAARWVRATGGELHARGPDPDLVRRITTGLPVGKPAHRTIPGIAQRWVSTARLPGLVAAAALLLAALWAGAHFFGRASGPLPTPGSDPRVIHPRKISGGPSYSAWPAIGTVEYAPPSSSAYTAPIPIENGRDIVTSEDEHATVVLTPWWFRGSIAGATRIKIDPLSKIVVQVYRFDELPEAYIPRRALLTRDPGATPDVEGPILEIQVLRGTALIEHEGFEAELAETDMVLLTQGRAPLRVDELDLGSEAAVATASGRIPSTENADPKLGAISGAVFAARDQQPLPLFEVTTWIRRDDATGSGHYRVGDVVQFHPNQGGAFRLDGLEPGTYRVGISAPAQVTTLGPAFAIEAGATTRLPPFHLQGGTTLEGQVVRAADGQAIRDATVRAISFSRPGWWRVTDTFGMTTTDARGTFRFANRPCGYHSIVVAAEGYARTTIPMLLVGPEGCSAGKIRLRAESVIHGRALGLDGNPLVGCEITLDSRSSCHRERKSTDRRGYFRFEGLAAGTYRVSMVSRDGLASRTRGLTLGESSIRRIDLGGEGTLLDGKLLAPDGQPLPECHVLFYEQTPGEKRFRRAPSCRTSTDESGRFRTELTPGVTFDLRVMPRRRDWSAPAGTLVVDPDHPSAYTCRLTGADLAGTLVTAGGDKPITARARLTLTVPGNPERTWRAELRAPAFTFHCVPAGHYKLSGWVRGYVLTPREIEVGEDVPRPVIAVRCELPARVEAQVSDPGGEIIPNLRVRRLSPGGGESPVWLEWKGDAAGYKLHGLRPGPIHLLFQAPGFESATVQRVLSSGELNRIELRLTPEKD